jgi:hypothetical protein
LTGNKTSIYFKLKKIALEVIETNQSDFDAHSSDIRADLVKRFMNYLFCLAERAKLCIKASKRFLEIMKLLPNRYKLTRLMQKTQGK